VEEDTSFFTKSLSFTDLDILRFFFVSIKVKSFQSLYSTPSTAFSSKPVSLTIPLNAPCLQSLSKLSILLPVSLSLANPYQDENVQLLYKYEGSNLEVK